MEKSGCEFCRNADFGRFAAWTEEIGDNTHANISLSGGSGKHPKDKQFNFCPVCGKPLKDGKETA